MHMIELRGKVVSRSQSLRGILRYGYTHGVADFQITESLYGKGVLFVTYDNGATACTTFEDFTVLQTWVAARKSWPQAQNS